VASEQIPSAPVPRLKPWHLPALALGSFAFGVFLLTVGDSSVWNESAGTVFLALALLAVATLPLLTITRAPLPSFVLSALAESALWFVTTPAGPPVAPTIAVFFLGLLGDGSRARTRLTLTVIAAMLLVHAGAAGLAGGYVPGGELLAGFLVWGIAWLAGDRTRLRAERIAELEDRALRAEREAERERHLAAAEERTRIARDLHDSAGHAINVILVHAGAGRMQAERDPARAREAFGTIEEVARETVGEIDQMVGALRERGDDETVEPPPGLAALEGLAERHRGAGMAVEIERRGEERPLPPGVDLAAYRILQEALTNAARHGNGAAQIAVEIGPSELALAVTNPVAAGNGGREDGHGLVGMRERALQLGGSLAVDPGPGEFRVRALLPLEGRR
jgi:signal transduction histidine kinase